LEGERSPDRVAEDSPVWARIRFRSSDRKAEMTIFWIIVMIIAVAAIVWLISRRRSRA
jgi:hypothetical protein